MRIGQTSALYFAGKILSAAIGFLATVYFARVLGAEILGYYALILAVVSWLQLGGTMGISEAVIKRISEGNDPDAYFTAGGLAMGVLFVTISVVVWLAADPLEAYLGVPHAEFVVLLLAVGLVYGLVSATLRGAHLVHVDAILLPVKEGAQSVAMVALVVLGYGLVGMLVGHALGLVVVSLVGLAVLSVRPRRPSRRQFVRLFDFAKFSWLGTLHSRAFAYVDIVVLGFFVQPALVGIYSVAWTLSKFLDLFGLSITKTIFPAMSTHAARREAEDVADLLSESLTYAGLILVPGFVGATLVGDRVLAIYGPEFRAGSAVLAILVAGLLVHSYQLQLQNALNAIDRPDRSFVVNAIFIGANVLLNAVLVPLIGWVGAAIATAVSAGIGLLVAYRYLRSLVAVPVPVGEIVRQWVAAGGMALVVGAGLWIEAGYGLLGHHIANVVVLVAVGAGAYFGLLLLISYKFRTTVEDNVPVGFSP